MTEPPSPEVAQKAIDDVQAHMDAAIASGDPAARRDHFRQAAQRAGYLTRVLDVLATPPPSPGGVPLNFGTARVPSGAPVLG